MNSIAAYCIAHFMEEFLIGTFHIHLGPHFFEFLGSGLEPFLEGAAVLFCYWLVLFWMYRTETVLEDLMLWRCGAVASRWVGFTPPCSP